MTLLLLLDEPSEPSETTQIEAQMTQQFTATLVLTIVDSVESENPRFVYPALDRIVR